MKPTAIQAAALEAVRLACEGKPVGVGCYAEVVAADVVTVGELVKSTELIPVVGDLLAGAAAAIRGERNPAKVRVFQEVDKLRALLETVKVEPA